MKRALALLSFVAALAPAGFASAAVPGPNGRIFFTSPMCGIASVNPDGTGFSCVSTLGRDPTVAPDGSKIAFTRGNQVHVIGADGGGQRQVTGPVDQWDQAYTASFGPDNETIAYLAFAGGGSAGIRGDIYTVRADGSGGRRLTTDQAYDPSYAGDGRIVYKRFDGVYVMNGDGSGQHMILANDNRTTFDPPGRVFIENEEPAFSPDGSTIAFTRKTFISRYECNPFPNCTDGEDTFDVDIWIMNADGSGLRQLTSTPQVDEVDPSISPDGTQVLYFRWPEANQQRGPAEETGELWIVGADGGGAHRLVQGSNPEWTNVTGGPAPPRLEVSGVPRGCVRGAMTLRLRVLGGGDDARMRFRLDGRYFGGATRKTYRLRIFGYQAKRPGRHRLKVVVTLGPEKLVRTIRFRRCRS